MPTGLKLLALAGMGKQSAFATGVAASQYLLLISEAIRRATTPMLSDDQKIGSRAQEFIADGPIEVSGSLTERMRYLLTTDPAHILLEQAFGEAGGHPYRVLIRESFIILRTASSDNEELADSFTPAATPAAQVITAVWLYLKRLGSPSGNLTVELQGDAAGAPDGTPVTNGTSDVVTAASISTEGQWQKFTFATNPSLTGGTLYHRVLKGTYTESAIDTIQMAVEDVASGGSFEIKDVSYADDATKNGTGRIVSSSFIDSFLMTDSIEGLYASLAVDKQVSVHEWIGMKVSELVLSSRPAEGLRAAYTLLGYDHDLTPSTTAAVLAGLKESQDRDRVTHKDMATAWVSDQVDVLASGDQQQLDSWELRMARPLDNVTPAGQRQVLEPLESGKGEVTLTVSLPRYAAETWRTWQDADTKLQGKFQWTLNSKFVTVLAPNMVIDGAVAIETGDDAPYSQQVTLRCLKNGAQNGFMAVNEEAELNYLA